MSAENIDIARQAYDAFNRGDVDGALRHISPSIEWRMSDRFTRVTRVFHGHSGVREVFALFNETLDGFRADPHTLHDFGPAVVAEVSVGGTLRGTGERMTYDLVQVWTIAESRAIRLDVYETLEEARAATGMNPPDATSDSISDSGSGRANR